MPEAESGYLLMTFMNAMQSLPKRNQAALGL